jgi:hypothetical protein
MAARTKPQEEYVTVEEIVGMFPVPLSPRHVRERVVRRNDFPTPYRVGRKRWWVKGEVQAWILARKEKAHAAARRH